MACHETKFCPRCQQPFECKLGNISECHCSSVFLTPENRRLMGELYTDCLCAACLKELAGLPLSDQPE
ncbi:MAG: cysteine-rich CWC family protein [Chitinophagaceae bacterium]